MTNFLYRLKRLLREKMLFFWAIIFPLGLATLFKMAFGDITKSDWSFNTINVAVVAEEGTVDKNFIMFLSDLKSGYQYYFKVTETSPEKAKEMLDGDEITAIIQTGETTKIIASENGISSTVVKTVVDGYLQSSKLLTKAAMEGKIEEAIAEFSNEIPVIAKKDYEGGSKDPMVQYFYALIAMASLYGALFGLVNAQELNAMRSPLAARRVASPLNKISTVLADVFSAFVIQYLQFLLLIGYYILILRIDFGDVNGYLFLAGALFSLLGVLYGYFIGTAVRMSDAIQTSVLMGTIMISCFMSGLMVDTIRIKLELSAPIVNRINPATLISGAMHYLCVLKDMNRFTECMIGLFIWCIALILGSLFFLWLYQKLDKCQTKERKEKAA